MSRETPWAKLASPHEPECLVVRLSAEQKAGDADDDEGGCWAHPAFLGMFDSARSHPWTFGALGLALAGAARVTRARPTAARMARSFFICVLSEDGRYGRVQPMARGT